MSRKPPERTEWIGNQNVIVGYELAIREKKPCSYCGTRFKADERKCRYCGGPRED